MLVNRIKGCMTVLLGVLPMLLGVALSSPVSSSEQDSPGSPARIEINGERYWYNKEFGRLRNLSETETEIVGEIRGKRGFMPFRVLKEEVTNPQAKSRALKLIVSDMVAWLKDGAPESKNYASAKLPVLTGEHFTDPLEWEKWYASNDDYLVWSEQIGRLIVDKEAKQAGIPAEQFRKSPTWKLSP